MCFFFSYYSIFLKTPLLEHYLRVIRMPTTRQEYLDMFITSPDEFVTELHRIPRAIWDFRPSPDIWSITDIIYHVVESEAQHYLICRTALAEPGKTIMTYDENVWLTALQTPAVSIDDLLELLLVMRRINGSILRALSNDQWRNTFNHPDFGITDLDTWLIYRAKHIPEHIAQIKRRHRDWIEHQQNLAV